MDEFTSDEEGFYFVCKDYEEDSFTLRKYNYEKKELSELNHFEMDTIEEGDETAQSDNYNVGYVDSNYIYITRNSFGGYYHKSKVYVIDKENGSIVKTISVDIINESEFLIDLFKINDKLYGIKVDSITDYITLYEINVEEEKAEKVGVILNFDMTDNIYIRGSKIYFMRSRNTSDITFTWYDVETKETGDIKRVCVGDFI